MDAASIIQPAELVRGNVKAVMKEVSATSADLWNVPLDQLKFKDGFNARVDSPEYTAHLENIANSIVENGFYQDKPIAAFVADENGIKTIYVTDGHTRVSAARMAVARGAQLTTLPVVIKPKGTTLEDLTIALVKSNDGKPFTPYETGLIVKRLIDMGIPEKKIAERLGFSGQYVNDLLVLVGAPKAVRDMVVAGQVSASVATKAIKKHGSGVTEKLKEAVGVAKAAGKTKVTGKHMVKRATLKLKGQLAVGYVAGAKKITIILDAPLDVELMLGDKVRMVITEDDSL